MKRMLSLCLGGALLLTGGLSHADGMDGIPSASPLAHGESVSTAAAKVMEPPEYVFPQPHGQWIYRYRAKDPHA